MKMTKKMKITENDNANRKNENFKFILNLKK